MECLIGITGKDFVLLASDTSCGRSIVSMKQGNDMQFIFCFKYAEGNAVFNFFRLVRNVEWTL